MWRIESRSSAELPRWPRDPRTDRVNPVRPVSALGLTPEVLDYEPGVAVFGGNDGLDGLRRVLEDSVARLNPAGWLIVEFGCGQDDAVTSLVKALPALALVAIRGDVQDMPRTAVMRKQG